MALTQAQFEDAFLEALQEEGFVHNKRDVREQLDIMGQVIAKGLKKEGRVTVRGVGIFSTKKKPATKKRRGINPFTKEEQEFAAKPASTQVKVRPAKVLKAPFEKK